MHEVYARVTRPYADLIAPGHMLEVEGDHIDVERTYQGMTKTRRVFKAEAVSPREWKVQDELPNKADLAS